MYRYMKIPQVPLGDRGFTFPRSDLSSWISKFQHPEPEQRDVKFLEDVRGRLVEGIGAEYLTYSAAADEAALVLAFRLRLFLKEIDRLTGWSIDHIADADRELYSWDTNFDHIEGITRVEPDY
jgi:hypothetical protein